MVNGCIAPTKKFVSSLVANELAYINSKHPEFTEAASIKAARAKKPEDEVHKLEIEPLTLSSFLES